MNSEYDFDYAHALEKLHAIGQEHLLSYWNELSPKQQSQLLNQLSTLDIDFYQRQKALVFDRKYSKRNIGPMQSPERSGSTGDYERGKKLIADGAVGCIIAAGGQGTRLAFDGPKGMFPVTRFQKKSLFQVFAEKCLEAGKRAGRLLPLAIMTSPENHDATVAYFKEKKYFGLMPQQVALFSQSELPLLDNEGNLFLAHKDSLALGPDGNGAVLHQFVKYGLYDAWKARGVRYLNFILVDNPLADPFDAELIGWQDRKGCEIGIKAIERYNELEKLGLLVREDGKIACIEYSEMEPAEFGSRLPNGQLKYSIGNISCFSFAIDFAKFAAQEIGLPWHLAHKGVPKLNSLGKEIRSDQPNSWKFERFIFDLLPHAKKADVLLYPRKRCFAPLKNATGDNSITAVQQALFMNELIVMKEITGLNPTSNDIELSQAFYYPSESLEASWRGRQLTADGYISEL